MNILILGIGNILFQDEGIGAHFIHYLDEKYEFISQENSVSLVDGGTLAQRLIPEIIKYDDLKAGISKLYASGNFNNITYKISEINDEENLLTLKVQENKTKQSIRFGLHYDDLFKTGLLLNFTSKNLFIKNSVLSADVVVGD